MNNVRIFYAHKAGDDHIRLQQEAKAVIAHLRDMATQKGQTITGTVTFGEVDHRKRFDGDWDEWAHSVSTARSSVTGDTLYNLIVVPEYAGGYVGKATASVLQGALRNKVKCFLATFAQPVPGEDLSVYTFIRITNVVCEDGNDFKSGWRVE